MCATYNVIYTAYLRRHAARAITKTFVDEEGDERLQIVYYQSGVGVATDFNGEEAYSDSAKKAFGTAVASKIRDAYNFIAQNYIEGDEISAYTARKISGLIDRLGLLAPKDMGKFFTYWKQLNGKLSGSPPRPDKPVPIKCLVTWDTVGSVRNGTQEVIDALQLDDDKLASNVENAWHAVSFHENREKFMCTLFGGAAEGQTLKQAAHSDVGGGYAEMELADTTLAWIVGEISKCVGIDEDFIEKSLSNVDNKPKWGTAIPITPMSHPVSCVPHGREQAITYKQGLCSAPECLILGKYCELNEFEAKVREFWHDKFRDGNEIPQFETQDDAEGLV
ncbi:hypothetical protein RHS01_07681 [Rhizoctonia solani]|uniref:T6SS Phospholipase effector Tle1-like catalytic domain-containing protein n=1 Tax=Rhizoctonia solani TaxID=456999 RepID=A0A8H7M2U3_9AGAM|nr:hypothetical protein RHS01_07681 [Rhizoctonia solani]